MPNIIEQLAVEISAISQKLDSQIKSAVGTAKSNLAQVEKPVTLKADTGGFLSVIRGAAGGALDALSKVGFAVFGLQQAASAVGNLASSMVSGNAEFERYETQFGVLLGSAQAAKERLAELAEFGRVTPFELPEVVRADKILQSFGFYAEGAAEKFGKSAKEMRTVIGDVAAGTGAGFEDIAFQIGKLASGATGEALMRFAELGIVTREQLGKMGIAFEKSGEVSDRTAVGLGKLTSTVLSAMEGKFGGMMDAQSKTFEGMMSNLKDWMGQAKRLMMAPLFDALKVQLKGLLDFLGTERVQKAIESFGAGLGKGISVSMKAVSKLTSVLVPLGKYLGMAAQEGDYLNDWLTHLPKPIQGVVKLVGQLVAAIAKIIKAFVGLAKRAVTIDDVAESLSELFGLDPKRFLSIFESFNKMVPKLKALATSLLKVGEALAPIVARDIINSFRLLLDIFIRLVDVGLRFANWLLPFSVGMADSAAKSQKFVDVLSKALMIWLAFLAAKKVVTITQNIVHIGQQLIATVQNVAGFVTQTIKVVGSLITKIADWGHTITQTIIHGGQKLIEKAVDWTQTITQDVKRIGDKFLEKAEDWEQTVTQKVKLVTPPVETFKDWALRTGASILTGIAAGLAAGGGLAVLISPAGLLVIAGLIIAGLVVAFRKQIGDFAQWYVNFTVEQFGKRVAEWQQLIPIIGGAIANVIPKIVDFVGKAWEFVWENLTPMAVFKKHMPYVVGAVLRLLQLPFENVGPMVADWLANVPDVIGRLFWGLLDIIKPPWLANIAWLAAELPTWPGRILSFLASIPDMLGGLWESAKTFSIGKLSDFWSWVSAEVPTWPGKFLAFLADIPPFVSDLFDRAKQWAIEKIIDLALWLALEVRTWPGRFAEWLADLPTKAWELFGSFKDRAIEALSDLWDLVGPWAWKIVNALMAPLRTIPDSVGKVLQDMQKRFQEGIDAINRLFGIRSPSKLMAQFGESIRKGFEIGLGPMTVNPIVSPSMMQQPMPRLMASRSPAVGFIDIDVGLDPDLANLKLSILRQVMAATEQALTVAGFGGSIVNTGTFAPG